MCIPTCVKTNNFVYIQQFIIFIQQRTANKHCEKKTFGTCVTKFPNIENFWKLNTKHIWKTKETSKDCYQIVPKKLIHQVPLYPSGILSLFLPRTKLWHPDVQHSSLGEIDWTFGAIWRFFNGLRCWDKIFQQGLASFLSIGLRPPPRSIQMEDVGRSPL